MTTTPFELADLLPKVEQAARGAGDFDPDEWVAYVHPHTWAELIAATPSDTFGLAPTLSGATLASGLEVRTNELCPREHMMVVSRSVLSDGLTPEQARDTIERIGDRPQDSNQETPPTV